MPGNTLLKQFVHISDTYPDHIALQDRKGQVSYAELRKRINKASSYFRQLGVGDGDRVAMVIENSIEYVVAFYAIWKVGGVIVALNPQAKFHEIENVIHQCKAKCLLAEKLKKDDLELLKTLDINIVAISARDFTGIGKWQDAYDCEEDEQWHLADESTHAQIIYTSGTTGNPKGVLLNHGNLIVNVEDIVDYLELTDKDSVLNVLPFHYCYGNSVLHTHFYVGGKVILIGSIAFTQDIVNTMRELKATGFSGVPSTYNLVLTHSDWADDPPPLRYMTQAGGPMGKRLTELLVTSSDPNTTLFVMYGQTEATARISWLPPENLMHKLGSAGIPLKRVKLEIRDENNQTLEHFQKGEVYISGPSIMSGYWENEVATQKALIDGWLKTGDLGYLDDDGYIFLEGRNSDMIKVGAHRINPLEIEEVINKLEFVKESAVIGVDDEVLGQKLRAFLVGSDSKKNLFALKKHCHEYLPTHKIPKEIMWVTELPKTASGKIKRFKLGS